MKNIFEEPLSRLSYEDIFAVVSEIGQETQRLEFKAKVPSKRKIAHIACSMANSIGGVVVVGIKDVKQPGDPVLPSDDEVDITDKAQGSLASVIQTLVYPSMSFETCGYRSKTQNDKTILVVRVQQSPHAPHEYLGGEESQNLPVRHDKDVRNLTLAEITMLQGRQMGMPTESPLGRRAPFLVIMRDAAAGNYFFGVHLAPEFYNRDAFEIGAKEVEDLTNIVHQATNWYAFSATVKADGIFFEEHSVDRDGHFTTPFRKLYIGSDGQVTLRYLERQQYAPRLFQVCALLANAYFIGSKTLRYFGMSPRARGELTMQLAADYTPSHKNETQLPLAHDQYLRADFARDSLRDAFTGPLMRTLRAAEVVFDRENLGKIIDDIWLQMYPDSRRCDIREEWLT